MFHSKKILLILTVMALAILGGCSKKTPEKITVGSLKGPTTMGIVGMMNENYLGDYNEKISYNMVTQADELVTAVVKGEMDIALVPANVAAVLYQKTDKKIKVIDINTLGVLYIVEKNSEINGIGDLENKTLYMTGKGTTPDYAIQYLLKANGIDIDKVDIQYCSEATEVISQMATNEAAIGLLPQPFVTTAMIKDENLKIALDLTEEWEKISGDSSMVTGVTIVRQEFMDEYPDAVKAFLDAHKKSVDFGKDNLDIVAAWIEKADIVKEAIAKKAYDKCHITFIEGESMKKTLNGYLNVLYDLNPASVGGAMPDDGFYYSR